MFCSLFLSEIARVIAPYVATGTGQLSLEAGNLINVRQKSPRGWWEGELQVRRFNVLLEANDNCVFIVIS